MLCDGFLPAQLGHSLKPAIGYIRVSTEEQAREGVSLDMQRQRKGTQDE